MSPGWAGVRSVPHPLLIAFYGVGMLARGDEGNEEGGWRMQSLRMSTKPPQWCIVLIRTLCMKVQLCLICLDYDGVYDKTRVHICVCVHTRLH